MVLKQISLQGEYIVFEVKANECKDSEQRLNGCMVYYKKDLFKKLGKEEIKCKKLELKHIAPYLPYELGVKTGHQGL